MVQEVTVSEPLLQKVIDRAHRPRLSLNKPMQSIFHRRSSLSEVNGRILLLGDSIALDKQIP